MSVATCMLNKLKSFAFVAQLERCRQVPGTPGVPAASCRITAIACTAGTKREDM